MRKILIRDFMPILFLVSIVISLWKFHLATPIIGIAFLFVGIVVAISAIIRKHRESYLQRRITRNLFARNVSLEIFGLLLAMTLAGLLGRHLAQIATEQISHHSIRFIVGIAMGLLAGMGVGVLVKRTWAQLVK
jgi:hypothetical protein